MKLERLKLIHTPHWYSLLRMTLEEVYTTMTFPLKAPSLLRCILHSFKRKYKTLQKCEIYCFSFFLFSEQTKQKWWSEFEQLYKHNSAKMIAQTQRQRQTKLVMTSKALRFTKRKKKKKNAGTSIKGFVLLWQLRLRGGSLALRATILSHFLTFYVYTRAPEVTYPA